MDLSTITLGYKGLILNFFQDLRSRLVRIIIFIGFIFIICFYLSENILEIIRAPIKDQTLVFLRPTEPFLVHLKLAFFTALALSIPFIAYHFWDIISPKLKREDRFPALLFFILTILFFFLGMLFCYFLIIPYGFGFLLTYKTSFLTARLSVDDYMSLTVVFLLIFGFVFELPIIIFFLSKLGIINPSMLTKNRKYVILVIFIISAVLTPPDVLTQILMAVPLTILYEVGIILSRMVYRAKVRRQESGGRSQKPE